MTPSNSTAANGGKDDASVVTASTAESHAETQEGKSSATWGFGRLVQSVQSTVQQQQGRIRAAQKAKEEGMIYDRVTQSWKVYLLDEEAAGLEAAAATETAATDAAPTEAAANTTKEGTPADRQVKDPAYYDMLGVSPNATQVELSHGYYKVARECHPDRHDPKERAHYTAEFRKLARAYGVLKDKTKREAYDQDGPADIDSTVEPSTTADADLVAFAVVFGNVLTEGYTGNLFLGQAALDQEQPHVTVKERETWPTQEQHDYIQDRIKTMEGNKKRHRAPRQVKSALFLRNRIESYCDNDASAFAQGCHEEALKICGSAMGTAFCQTIGFSLQVAAQEYLAARQSNRVAGQVARTRMLASEVATNWKWWSTGVKMVAKNSTVPKNGTNDQNTPASATMNDALPAALEMMWLTQKPDIQAHLAAACTKLFQDASVSMEGRISRAQAVLVLGREFLQVAQAQQRKTFKQMMVG